MTGRKAVINTAIDALAQEKHDVDLFVLANRGAAEHRSRTFWLGTVPKTRALFSAALALVGSSSLNEALFRSRSALAFARQLRQTYDFAIADTIRAAPYANALGVPWHLDLDDLFSRRYERYLEWPEQLSADLVLGYYRDSVPRMASAVPKTVLKHLLKGEAVRLGRRELYWAGKASTVSLVSPDEAETFARSAARHVHNLPMSVPVPAQPWTPVDAGSAAPVFLGGLDYKPNLDALLYYQSEIAPRIGSGHGKSTVLHHIGNAPASLREKFRPDVVRFDGYVPDLTRRLRDASFFVAPIVSGTGIKTKVLEAMAVGLPVLATRQAVSGLHVQHKKHCFICERPADFAEGVRFVGDACLAGAMGAEARKYAEANFSMGVLRRRWNDVIEQLARSSRAGGAKTRTACSTP
jgi:hypothetical protein